MVDVDVKTGFLEDFGACLGSWRFVCPGAPAADAGSIPDFCLSLQCSGRSGRVLTSFSLVALAARRCHGVGQLREPTSGVRSVLSN